MEEQLKDVYEVNDFVAKFSCEVNKFVCSTNINSVYNLYNAIKSSKRIFLAGNGGSWSNCDHIANDLFKRCNIEAHVMSSGSMLTCFGNDYTFENIYIEWLKRFNLNENDLLISISSSGKSKNILHASAYAKSVKCKTIGIFGFQNTYEESKKCFDDIIWFKESGYGVHEISSICLIHGIIEKIVEENG